MTPHDFVKGFYQERQSLIEAYFHPESSLDVSSYIKSLNLGDNETARLMQIFKCVLRDAFYTVLLGLDGEASIGERQHAYRVLDESGEELTGGAIEAAAYDYFHSNRFQVDNGSSDFIATISYLKTDEGGRLTPALSGYRPQVKFSFSDIQTSGQQTFIDTTIAYPGDKIEAEIKLGNTGHLVGQLKDRMKFDLLEGAKVIASGWIKYIVNQALRAPAR